MTPCPNFPKKVQHATREEALAHQKTLVFRNASTDQPDKSKELNVYPASTAAHGTLATLRVFRSSGTTPPSADSTRFWNSMRSSQRPDPT